MLSEYDIYDDCYSNSKFLASTPDLPSPIGCFVAIEEARVGVALINNLSWNYTKK